MFRLMVPQRENYPEADKSVCGYGGPIKLLYGHGRRSLDKMMKLQHNIIEKLFHWEGRQISTSQARVNRQVRVNYGLGQLEQ